QLSGRDGTVQGGLDVEMDFELQGAPSRLPDREAPWPLLGQQRDRCCDGLVMALAHRILSCCGGLEPLIPQLPLNGPNHGEVGVEAWSSSGDPMSLDIDAGCTEIERAFGKATSHCGGKPFVVRHPHVPLVTGQTLPLPSLRVRALLDGPRPAA